MSFRRFFRWICDTCAAEQDKETYGLPPGWTWTHGLDEPVKHRCPKCTVEAKERKV